MNQELSTEEKTEYIRVANYYYTTGLTQQEIARKMSMSRQRVNRILSRCRQLGIVKIEIPELEETYAQLETQLESKFGLKAVRISRSLPEDQLYGELGITGSRYLMSIISDNATIGLARGRSVAALVDNMPVKSMENLTAVQLMGSWNNEDSKANSDDIVHRFGEKTGSHTTMLYAPVVVKTRELRDSIINETYFENAYETIKACDIAIVGIGQAQYPKLLPLMGPEDYDYNLRRGAVGEVCAHFYNRKGEKIDSPFDKRVITVGYEDFLNIPVRIGVAGFRKKKDAILGALKGGIINVLITDLETAELLRD